MGKNSRHLYEYKASPSRGNSGFMEDIETALKTEPVTNASDMLSKEQVNEIVKREKADAARRTREELEGRHRQEMERMKSEFGGRQQEQSPMMDRDAMYQEFRDKLTSDLRQKAQQDYYKKVGETYNEKMSRGSKIIDNFNEVMAPFDPTQFWRTSELATELDNMPDVMGEIVSNPQKLTYIENLAEKSPELARRELKKISQSVAQNIQAKESNIDAPPPLSRLKSSTQAGADSGLKTVRDYKNASWLRG